jgi:hypothetical protein
MVGVSTSTHVNHASRQRKVAELLRGASDTSDLYVLKYEAQESIHSVAFVAWWRDRGTKSLP